MFEEGRSNIFIHERTLLDLDDISKLRDEYEREKILERKKQDEEEYLLVMSADTKRKGCTVEGVLEIVEKFFPTPSELPLALQVEIKEKMRKEAEILLQQREKAFKNYHEAREKILERKKQYDEEQLCGDNE